MSRFDAVGCACIGIPISALTVTAGGGRIAGQYVVFPWCDPTTSRMEFLTDSSGVFTYEAVVVVDGIDTNCRFTMTITDFNAEGVEVKWERVSDDLMLWRAVNREHWNPAVGTTLKVMTHSQLLVNSLNIGSNIVRNACLRPAIYIPPEIDFESLVYNCGCNCDTVQTVFAFQVQLSNGGVDAGQCDGAPDEEECLEQLAAFCAAANVSASVIWNGNWCWLGYTQIGEITIDEVTYPWIVGVQVWPGGDDGQHTNIVAWVNADGVGPGGSGASTQLTNIRPCEWLYSGAAAGGTTNVGVCASQAITVTPMVLNSSGLAVDCPGEPIDIERCPPQPRKCKGTSTSRIIRSQCSETTYVYAWEQVIVNCGGNCKNFPATCRHNQPYPLVEEPLTDAEATSLGYIALLGVEQPGGCHCTTVTYEPPVCGEDCTCEETIHNLSLTVSGASDAAGEMNGTYTLIKGDTECGEDVCCWSGFKTAGSGQAALLVWELGVWTLTLTPTNAEEPQTIYQTEGLPCDETIILAKQAGSSFMPGSVTILSL